MSYYKHPPLIPLPVITEYDSFLYKYKISIRRTRDAFIDDAHYHEHIAIWYNTSGEYNMYFNGTTVQCTPGTLFFMPPFAVHALDTRKSDMSSTEIICISLPSDSLYKRRIPVYPLSFDSIVFENKKCPLCLKFYGEEKMNLDNLFRAALSEYTKKKDMLRTRIFEVTDKIIEICAMRSEEKLSLTQLTAAIKRADNIRTVVRNAVINFTSPPSVEDSAKICDITSRGFTKLFKRITNLTYHDFITAVRSTKAANLLLYTKKSMAEIAEECGYVDNSHFTKTMIKLYGSPPHKLRAEMIEVRFADIESQKLSDQLHSWESTLDSETRHEHFLNSLGLSD